MDLVSEVPSGLNSPGRCRAYSLLWCAYHVNSSLGVSKESAILQALWDTKTNSYAQVIQALYAETNPRTPGQDQQVFASQYGCNAVLLEQRQDVVVQKSENEFDYFLGDVLNGFFGYVENKPGGYVISYHYSKRSGDSGAHAVAVYGGADSGYFFDPNSGVYQYTSLGDVMEYIADRHVKALKEPTFLRLVRVDKV